MFVSTAHTHADIDETIAAIDESLAAVASAEAPV
jgi:glutamate-1-semialdehyde aminotransferase